MIKYWTSVQYPSNDEKCGRPTNGIASHFMSKFKKKNLHGKVIEIQVHLKMMKDNREKSNLFKVSSREMIWKLLECWFYWAKNQCSQESILHERLINQVFLKFPGQTIMRGTIFKNGKFFHFWDNGEVDKAGKNFKIVGCWKKEALCKNGKKNALFFGRNLETRKKKENQKKQFFQLIEKKEECNEILGRWWYKNRLSLYFPFFLLFVFTFVFI